MRAGIVRAGQLGGSREAHFHASQWAEVGAGHVARTGKTVPCARPRADYLPGGHGPAMRSGPIDHPRQAGHRVAHSGPALTRFDVPTIQVQVHSR